jgi:uncharacterized protein with GYD domain
MAYRSASKLTFSPAWQSMNADQRAAEQVAAIELIAKYGGELEGQWWLWTDQVLLSITKYPDEASHMKASAAIGARGAFQLVSQTALTLDEIAGIQSAIAAD